MKLSFYFFLLILFSSQAQEKNSKETACLFLDNLYGYNFEEAKKYCNNDVKKTVDIIQNISNYEKEKQKQNIKIVKSNVNRNNATISYIAIKESYQEPEEILILQRINNKWIFVEY